MQKNQWKWAKEHGPHAPAVRPIPRRWSDWGEPIRLSLTANAGILVDYRGASLLIDGIHNGGDHPFSPVPSEMLTQMAAGQGIFSGLCMLAFTHTHCDHFSATALAQFLTEHPVERIFLSPDSPGEDAATLALRQELLCRGYPLQVLDPTPGFPVSVPLFEGMRLTALRTPHMGGDPIPHLSLLLQAGGKTLLFLGDAEAESNLFEDYSGLPHIQTAVVNPLLLNRSGGRALLERLGVEQIVVTHIPFHEQDDIRFRDFIVRELANRGDSLPPAAVLWDPLNTLTL